MGLQDMQVSMNWYPEISRNPGSKEPVALLGAPGLTLLVALPTGPVRGLWVLPGGKTAIAVGGNTAYFLTDDGVSVSYKTLGTLDTSSGIVNIRDNATGGIAVIVDGSNGYVVNIAARSLAKIQDEAWLGATKVLFIDGWFIFNRPDTQTFYTSPLYWNGVAPLDATYFALKDSSSDNIVTMIEDKREMWLIGERTTEVWYDAGNPTFPFGRVQGITMQHGCAAVNSIARVGSDLFWLGKDEQGSAYLLQTQGYTEMPLINHGIDNVMASFSSIEDAVAYGYQEDGHLFYVVTFPSADQTWVYDVTSNMWHQRGSYDSILGVFHRHRSNCYAYYGERLVVGDYVNGNIYAMSRKVYADNGDPLVCWRRTSHIWDEENRERVFHSQLQIEFTPGVGLSYGQGTDPQAVLKWSDDGGQTWGNEHWTSIGRIGQTKNRAIWRRLGYARDRIYDVKLSDPVSRDVIGASLMVL
jgi:hypothetical protein